MHDELGPALAGVALTLEAAQRSDRAGSVELMREAQQQAQAIVGDVRRIVHGLRPPVLDELGLAAALRAYGERLAPLEVMIDVPSPAPEQSAAAETAIYRIATEALTNVVRHASARRAHSPSIGAKTASTGRSKSTGRAASPRGPMPAAIAPRARAR